MEPTLFDVIELAVRVILYMRSRDLASERLESSLHSLLLDAKRKGTSLRWPFGFTLGHIRNLYDNYAGLRRFMTLEDRGLLLDVTPIRTPRIEDRDGWADMAK
jgi:hypothetical protein